MRTDADTARTRNVTWKVSTLFICDAIHPGGVGHRLMGELLLRARALRATGSSRRAHARAGSTAEARTPRRAAPRGTERRRRASARAPSRRFEHVYVRHGSNEVVPDGGGERGARPTAGTLLGRARRVGDCAHADGLAPWLGRASATRPTVTATTARVVVAAAAAATWCGEWS